MEQGENKRNSAPGTGKRAIKKLKATIKALEAKMEKVQNRQGGEPNPPATGNAGAGTAEGIGPAAHGSRGGRRRQVSKVLISKVRQYAPALQPEESAQFTVGYLDEDSHADMHCAGSNFVLLQETNYTCEVDPFIDSIGSLEVPIAKTATAFQVSADRVAQSSQVGPVYDLGSHLYVQQANALLFSPPSVQR